MRFHVLTFNPTPAQRVVARTPAEIEMLELMRQLPGPEIAVALMRTVVEDRREQAEAEERGR